MKEIPVLVLDHILIHPAIRMGGTGSARLLQGIDQREMSTQRFFRPLFDGTERAEIEKLRVSLIQHREAPKLESVPARPDLQPSDGTLS